MLRCKKVEIKNRIPEIFGRKAEDDTKYGKSITRDYIPRVNSTFATQFYTKIRRPKKDNRKK
jgi:hypothetical protein